MKSKRYKQSKARQSIETIVQKTKKGKIKERIINLVCDMHAENVSDTLGVAQ